jgi:hypothetical protein
VLGLAELRSLSKGPARRLWKRTRKRARNGLRSAKGEPKWIEEQENAPAKAIEEGATFDSGRLSRHGICGLRSPKLKHLSEIISENRTERPRHRSGERTPGGEKGPLPLLRVQLSGVPPENSVRRDAPAAAGRGRVCSPERANPAGSAKPMTCGLLCSTGVLMVDGSRPLRKDTLKHTVGTLAKVGREISRCLTQTGVVLRRPKQDLRPYRGFPAIQPAGWSRRRSRRLRGRKLLHPQRWPCESRSRTGFLR